MPLLCNFLFSFIIIFRVQEAENVETSELFAIKVFEQKCLSETRDLGESIKKEISFEKPLSYNIS